MVAVYRFLAHIPVPFVSVAQIQSIFSGNQALSFLNILSGGTLANFSLAAVGINPFITASIVMSLAAMVIPSLKEMQKESEAGREKFNQYTRLLSVPLAIAQSISVLALLTTNGLLQNTSPLAIITIVVTLVAGAMVMMWLGELITMYGIGNGISIILLISILSQAPVLFAQFMAGGTLDMFTIATMTVVLLVVIALIVVVNEGVRRVPIQYAKRVRGSRMYGGQQSFLPVKVNVSGVMPIIFAVTLMIAPSVIAKGLEFTQNPTLVAFGQKLTLWFDQTSISYMVVYFVIVFAFTFFSALLYFNAKDISDELKKSGAFVPGIRPGTATKKYLEFVVTRITFVGAVFLSLLAVLPLVAQRMTGITSLAIGGTSLLIVVSVILETTKQMESYTVEQNYDKYVGG